jgi:hypothetical protein
MKKEVGDNTSQGQKINQKEKDKAMGLKKIN